MPDDGYSSAWDSVDHSDFQSTAASHTRQPMRSLDVQDAASTSQPPSMTAVSHLSADSEEPGAPQWRDTSTMLSEPADGPTEQAVLIDPGFDENVLRLLCEMDCGVPLLLDRIKQSMVSCREAAIFLKKRAVIEEEYGKTLQKLSRSTGEVYAMNDGKAGTFVTAWQSSMRIHELMSENRLRFAQRLNEMSEELVTLSKEVDKNRKHTKDLATRYERALLESEGITEKSKARLDITSEELERVLLQKEGESFKDNPLQASRPGGAGGKRVIGKAVAKGGLLLKGKNPGNIQRQEEDVRARMSSASDAFRKAVTDTQAMRQEYYNFQLPRILRALKECADEIDLGTQYHLTRYAFLFESIVLSDGSTLVPPREEGSTLSRGLKSSVESIDNRTDFKTFMQNYAYARGNQTRGPRRDGPADEGFLPPIPSYNRERTPDPPQSTSNGHIINLNGPSDKGRPTYGVDLAEQMVRDDVEVPPIMKKLTDAIEKYGVMVPGIYRISGTTSKVNRLKELLDRDLDAVNMDASEWSSDINNAASALKLWLRELPDPLITASQQAGFVEASKIDNERLRHIRLHERVNDLPDANYATLKFLLGHLHRLLGHSASTQMDSRNYGIVFGPTLFGQVMHEGLDPSGISITTELQSKTVEKVLDHYTDIFVDESD